MRSPSDELTEEYELDYLTLDSIKDIKDFDHLFEDKSEQWEGLLEDENNLGQ